MAKYTTSIKDILQTYSGDEDLWLTSDMTTISKACLFGDELNQLKPEYRDHFATSFAYHYFLDEIGLETFGLWRMRLMGRIYEHADYINHIYDTMKKDIFSEYKVTRRVGKITDDGSEHKDYVDSVERDIETDGTNDTTSDGTVKSKQKTENDLKTINEYNSKTQNTGTTTDRGTGSITEQRRGTDTTKDTGWTDNEHRGYDTLSYLGSEKTTRGGQDTTKHRGNDVSSRDGVDHNKIIGKEINKQNEVTIHSDTPMGSLENMLRSPQQNADGQGVAYETQPATEFNYMSDAQQRGVTSVREYDGYDSQTEYDSSTDTQYNSDEIEEYGSNQTLEYINRKDKNEYNSNNKQNDNRTSATTYNSDNTSQRNTTDVRTDNTQQARLGQDTEKNTGNQTTDVDGTTKDIVKEKAHATTNDDTVRDGEHDITRGNIRDIEDDGTSYVLSYEMLLKAEPLMDRIWRLFDSLFMCIY